MTIATWPTDLPCGIPDLSLQGGAATAGSNGLLPSAIGATFGGPHWVAVMPSLPIRNSLQLAAARGLEGLLDGGATPIMVNVCVGGLSPAIAGSPGTSCTLSADALAGATSIHLAFSGAHRPLVGGEMFNVDDDDVGKRLHMVVEVTGGTTDAPIVRIKPPLRAALSSGDPVTFDDLACPMRLVEGFDLPVSLGRFSETSATFEEWFDPPVVLALRNLTLSPHNVESGSAEDTFVGDLIGVTAGSTVTITNTAGSRFKLLDNGDGTWSIVAGSVATDYGSAHSHNITVRETLAGYTNTPRDSIIAIQVTVPLPTSMVLNLTNPGFETGDLTGWTTSDPSCTPLTGTTHSGLYALYGGNVGSSTAYQIGDGDSSDPYFDVSSFAARIDTGHVVLQGWECWRNETTSQGDTGQMEVWFYDGAGAFISEAHVSGLNFPVGWQRLIQGDLAVPVGTRRIKLGCSNTRAVGPALQNFFDDFASSVTLQYS